MTMTNVDHRKARRDAVTEDEREILTHLCVRLKLNDTDQEQQDVEQKEEDNTDLDEQGNLEQQFLQSFLTYLYSGNYPRKAGVGVVVNKLIDWLTNHGFHRPIWSRGDINETMPFTPNMLVRSVSVQLAVELQRIYGQGTQDIHKQAPNRSPTSELPFVSFTETELASFFWKREPLKRRLTDLGAEDGSLTNTFTEIANWIAGQGPGNIINQFIADVAPQVATSRQRKKEGHRGAVNFSPWNKSSRI
ncbi:hypothetical protein BGX24_007122 [Mortierella sp. AD032]|nr:hypothetical protein BGX24_007122 [Mortierella sp. AD032]